MASSSRPVNNMFDPDAFMARLAGPPLLMGILNVTPDSFSDGGQFDASGPAIAHAIEMANAGADIIDIGGESTRPGHTPVDAEAEQRRIMPVIHAVTAAVETPISVDTYKAATARAALDAGAHIVNDIWGLQRDPLMARVVADAGCPIICMHNRDAIDPDIDMIADIKAFLEKSLEIAHQAGIQTNRIILDPGFGFGKSFEQSLDVLARVGELQTMGLPLLIGLSRKGFIGHFSGNKEVGDRLAGTLSANMAAINQGAAQIIRVHAVKPHREMLDFASALAPVQK